MHRLCQQIIPKRLNVIISNWKSHCILTNLMFPLFLFLYDDGKSQTKHKNDDETIKVTVSQVVDLHSGSTIGLVDGIVPEIPPPALNISTKITISTVTPDFCSEENENTGIHQTGYFISQILLYKSDGIIFDFPITVSLPVIEDRDNLNYTWSSIGGSDNGFAVTNTGQPPFEKAYTVTYAVKDGNGGDDSDTMQVTVSSGGTRTVTDIDGNVYQTIIIGNQEWMSENLKVTHYRNGDAIPHLTNDVDWTSTSSGAYCVYENNESIVSIYGRLYNWFAVDDRRNIAPVGWHVPTDAEFKELEMYIGMSQSEADDTGYRGINVSGELKESGSTHWKSPYAGATNESGFTALPGGYRYYNGGNYNHLGSSGSFWTSTKSPKKTAWFRTLDYHWSEVYRNSHYFKTYGFSVRCVRNSGSSD